MHVCEKVASGQILQVVESDDAQLVSLNYNEVCHVRIMLGCLQSVSMTSCCQDAISFSYYL